MTMAYQSRLHLLECLGDCSAPCRHTRDNNKTSLIALLSIALVATIFLMVTYWFLPISLRAVISEIVPRAFSLIGLIVGIVGTSSVLTRKIQARTYLSFFIIKVLLVISLLGLQVSAIIKSPDALKFDRAIGLLQFFSIYLFGPTMVLVWQTRQSLIGAYVSLLGDTSPSGNLIGYNE
jgi:hypothetical protein